MFNSDFTARSICIGLTDVGFSRCPYVNRVIGNNALTVKLNSPSMTSQEVVSDFAVTCTVPSLGLVRPLVGAMT